MLLLLSSLAVGMLGSIVARIRRWTLDSRGLARRLFFGGVLPAGRLGQKVIWHGD